jgi:hypothetical protein
MGNKKIFKKAVGHKKGIVVHIDHTDIIIYTSLAGMRDALVDSLNDLVDKPAMERKKYSPPPDMHIWLQEFRASGFDAWAKLIAGGLTAEQAPKAATACAEASTAYADAMLAGYKKHRDKGGLPLAAEH